MNHRIDDLLSDIRGAAAGEPFPLDVAVYLAAGRDPLHPILFAGTPSAPVAFLGRDLGRDEVDSGEPLIGQAGRLVRRGLARAAGCSGEPSEEELARAVRAGALLTNTVPYKPPGNREYARKVRERFRPFLAALLGRFFAGDRVITLGNAAYQWFEPYSDPEAFRGLWKDEEGRYARDLEVLLGGEWRGGSFEKHLRVSPLPHPSPLNATWFSRFPGLLDARLGVTPR